MMRAMSLSVLMTLEGNKWRWVRRSEGLRAVRTHKTVKLRRVGLSFCASTRSRRMEGSCIARNEARELSGFGGNFYELPTQLRGAERTSVLTRNIRYRTHTR